MTWDWVAPVATAIVGIAGTTFTWLTGKQGRDHTEHLTQQRLDHEAEMAKDQRRQQRLADTYVDLLTFAYTMGAWANLVRPILDTDPPKELPVGIPPVDEQIRVEARAGAFASAEVRRLVKIWRDSVGEIRRADYLLSLCNEARKRGEDSGIDDAEQWLRLRDLRPIEQEHREALTGQIAAELGSRASNSPTGTELRLKNETPRGGNSGL